MKWQPIETAPRDGTGFLAWCPVWGAHLVLFIKDNAFWMPVGKDGLMAPRGAAPTYWQPLPEPPE